MKLIKPPKADKPSNTYKIILNIFWGDCWFPTGCWYWGCWYWGCWYCGCWYCGAGAAGCVGATGAAGCAGAGATGWAGANMLSNSGTWFAAVQLAMPSVHTNVSGCKPICNNWSTGIGPICWPSFTI